MSTHGMFDLTNKRALIFGGTSGIGRAIALAFAEAGANVVPVSRREEEVRKTAREVRDLGRDSLELTADVCSRQEVQRTIDAMCSRIGGIDILVNSAGTSKRMPSLEVTDEIWENIMKVNLDGTWYACQIAGKIMKSQGYGRIINIASLGAHVALHEVTPYCVSKAAVAMMTKCLAAEWAIYNITVNTITPGVIETPLSRTLIHDPKRMASILSRTPMKRLGTLEEIKAAAVYLASDAASFVTGSTLSVDGGFLAQGIGPS